MFTVLGYNMNIAKGNIKRDCLALYIYRFTHFVVFFATSVQSRWSRSVLAEAPGLWTWSWRLRLRCWETLKRNTRRCCDWPKRWPITSTTWCRRNMHWATPSLISARSHQNFGWVGKKKSDSRHHWLFVDVCCIFNQVNKTWRHVKC